ncbi:MAG: cation:proton antiporter [Sphingobacteriia bacterium]|nr:cation:proton antiporter [Sphingobacteriia bacterium]NCC38848.1 cation:proton antiporter [Gammaproteobacteria bacterium]
MTLNLIELSAAILMGAAVILALLRLVLGPTAPDRVVAADTLTIIMTLVIVGLALLFVNPVYLDIALVFGVLAFVGVVAIARAIEGGRS